MSNVLDLPIIPKFCPYCYEPLEAELSDQLTDSYNDVCQQLK
jgi:hypothetical protein